MLECRTIEIKIYMAGDYQLAKQVVNEYCYSTGFCVSMFPMDYIYTGGQELGFCVNIINYPRFPSDSEALINRAKGLALILKAKLCQKSYTIVTPEKTYTELHRLD